MQKRTKSLLEELDSIGSHRDMHLLIESRANNVIASAINLLELISHHYNKEKTEILEKKLLGAIKSKQPAKFSKSLRKKHNESKAQN
jgi:hypothetical protein